MTSIRVAVLFTAVITMTATASAQSSGDPGSLWRGGAVASAPAKKADSVPARRTVDSAAVRRASDSAAAVAKRTRDSVAAAAAKRVSDSVIARVAKADTTIRAQKDSIAQLRAQLATTKGAETVVAALSARIDSVQAAQKAAVKQAADAEQRIAQRVAGLGNFRFSGDLRVRYEGMFQHGGVTPRHRERSRARIGISGSITEEVTAGVAIATGAFEDVQSPNQTQTGFFARKAVGFDRFFVQWKPKAVAGLTLVGGKFAYPWERTSLTFGNDINPEGAAASWTRSWKSTLQGVGVVGFVLPLFEVSGGQDSYIVGGQLQTRWKPGPRTSARLSVTSMNFHGADALAVTIAGGTFKPSAPATNRTRTDSAGKVVGYAHEFGYREVLGAWDYSVSPRLPVSAQINLVQNGRVDSDNNTAMWTDLKVGRLSQPRDVQASWTVFRIERDAVLGAFNEQDLRAATNVINHKVGVVYQLRSNATVGVGAWFGRLLDAKTTGKLTPPAVRAACTTAPSADCRDYWVKRLQFDLSYKF